MQDYTQDYLLNQKVQIFQPINGYRASTDAVFLSSLINKVKKGQSILDVGSGTGAVSLCLARRFAKEEIKIVGLELQEQLAQLSNLSAQKNGYDKFLKYINCNIKDKIDLPNCSFDHVITNPPYSEKDMPSPNNSKAFAHNHHDLNLEAWISFCIKMIKPKGFFYMINRAEAIDDILYCLHERLGNITIIPLYSKPEQDAKRIMIMAQKDSRAATKINSGLIVHNSDGEYTPQAEKILRQAHAFFD